ncbi:serine/threonine protein kinase [Streptacidiphilus sp. MAP12-20]
MAKMRLRREDPRLVGPYRLHRRLGSGGMGVVYLGSDRKGQKVALKLIRAELAEDQEFRTRFAREVAAAARIRGGCIARLVSSDIEAERPWLATAYVPGPSLYKRVGDDGPLHWPEVAAVGAALADGLAQVHDAGVVHRDLKPSNILLSPKGPRIIDFGIAWSSGASTLTHVGTAVGSPGFLAPEQVRGVSVTGATDVFALGSTLAYAATGDTPFGSGSSEVMLYRVVHEEPDLTGVPAALAPLLRACLAKDPSERPTPAQLHERLRELAARGAAIGRSMAPPPARSPEPGHDTGHDTNRRGEVSAARRDARVPHETARSHEQAPRSAAASGGTRPAVRRDQPSRPLPQRRPMPPTVREPQPTPVRRPAPPRTPPPARPTARPTGGPAARRRLLRQRLIVFVTVTAGVALAIAAAQGCENRTAKGAGPAQPPTHGPTASPAFPASSAPTGAAPAQDVSLGLVAAVGTDATAQAVGAVDWASRSYQDPADGSRIDLQNGHGTGPGAPVSLTAVLPARYQGSPAAVVVLTRRDRAVPEDMIELYGLQQGAEPVLLAAHASTGDPNGTSAWQIENGSVLREERTPASGDRTTSTTRFTVAAKGTMTETWPGAGGAAASPAAATGG